MSSSIETLYRRHGAVDYNHAGSAFSLTDGNTTDILNDGLGVYTNEDNLPLGVESYLSSGKIVLDGLSIGEAVLLRIDGSCVSALDDAVDIELELFWQAKDNSGSNTFSFSIKEHILNMTASTRVYEVLESVILTMDGQEQVNGEITVKIKPTGGDATFTLNGFKIVKL